jgi:hypothetical protein
MRRDKQGLGRWKRQVARAAYAVAMLSLGAACSDEEGDARCAPGQVCQTGVLNVGDLVDVDGDGKADGRAVDGDGDGKADSLDTNGDGIGDAPLPNLNSDTDPVTGGDGDGDASGDGDVSSLPPITVKSAWCDALAVLRTGCQECHSANVESTAPMPLDTYADLMKPAVTDTSKKVYELVSLRIHDTEKPMPEPPRTLTAEQLAALDSWIAGGAQPGPDESCTTAIPTPDLTPDAGTDLEEPPVAAEWPADCEEIHKITVGNNQGHVVRAGVEEHPQFYFDAPWGADPVQAVAIRPITDNKKVLHHWILYESGGTGGGAAGGKFLSGWSPGKDGMRTFPEDIGMYLPGGKQVLRLDTHYYNKGGTTDQTDQSGVEICITRHFRKNTAGTYAFGTLSISLPPGRDTPITAKCTVTGGPVYLLNSSPHMHKLGYWAQFWKTSGGQQTMLQDTAFNFEFQEGKALDRVQLNAGDTVTTVCKYKNDTGATVRFGQNTENEMCFNFALYYPIDGFSCRTSYF